MDASVKGDLSRAWRLGDGNRERARLLAAATELRFRTRSSTDPLRVKLMLGRHTSDYSLFDRAHLWNLDEIWLRGEYGHLYGDFDHVLDLGANIGASSIWFHEHFPDATIVAVEPDPRTAPLLRRNTTAFPRISVVEAAVGVRVGHARLLTDTFTWGSRVVDFDDVRVRASGWPVRTLTIPSLLQNAPDGARVLVKMDIEGSEWSLLSDPRALELVSEIYGETHRFGAPADSADFFARASRAAGFEALSAPHTFFHWRREKSEH